MFSPLLRLCDPIRDLAVGLGTVEQPHLRLQQHSLPPRQRAEIGGAHAEQPLEFVSAQVSLALPAIHPVWQSRPLRRQLIQPERAALGLRKGGGGASSRASLGGKEAANRHGALRARCAETNIRLRLA